MNYTIRPVTGSDANAIHNIMVEVQRGVMRSRDGEGWTDAERADVRDFFIISDLARVRHKLANPNGFGWIAEGVEGDGAARPVAYHLFEVLPEHPSDGISAAAGVPADELGRVVEADSVAVLPAWRGLGLQRELEALGEAEARRRGCLHMVATVHPRNEHSLGNFLAAGYRVAAHVWDDTPADRVLHDDPRPDEPTSPVERYVVRKDLA